jgi:hypothetical protein
MGTRDLWVIWDNPNGVFTHRRGKIKKAGLNFQSDLLANKEEFAENLFCCRRGGRFVNRAWNIGFADDDAFISFDFVIKQVVFG